MTLLHHHHNAKQFHRPHHIAGLEHYKYYSDLFGSSVPVNRFEEALLQHEIKEILKNGSAIYYRIIEKEIFFFYLFLLR